MSQSSLSFGTLHGSSHVDVADPAEPPLLDPPFPPPDPPLPPPAPPPVEEPSPAAPLSPPRFPALPPRSPEDPPSPDEPPRSPPLPPWLGATGAFPASSPHALAATAPNKPKQVKTCGFRR